MHRFIPFVLLTLFGIMMVAAPQQVDSQSSGAREGVLISAESLPNHQDVQELHIAVDLTRVSGRAIDAANDTCGTTNNLPTFFNNNVDTLYISSDVTRVNGYSTDASDPDISSCMAGSPGTTQGYRTAWYRFVAPVTGDMTVSTVFNASYTILYDTVVAVYSGSTCATQSLMVCNDDSNGLLSSTSTWAVQGQTYYIEIADRNLAVNGDVYANLTVTIDSEDFWSTDADWNKEAAIRSRHATAIVGDDIYVIGGQTIVNGVSPSRTPRVDKFNTATGDWTSLAPMPPACGGAGGYSNTDASYVTYTPSGGTVQHTIFVPSGYVGDDGVYASGHCAYDITNDSWSVVTTAPWTNGEAPAFAATAERPGTGYFVTGGLVGPWIEDAAGSPNGTDVLFYSPVASAWITSFPSLPTGRYAHTAELVGNRLYVMGGLRTVVDTNSGDDAALLIPDGYYLDLTNTGAGWQAVSGPNTPRFQASSGIGDDGRMYIWGGLNSSIQPVTTVEVYDEATGTWYELDGRFNLANPGRSWARGGFVNGKLVVIGGETSYALNNTAGSDKYTASVTGIVEMMDTSEVEIPDVPLTGLTNLVYLPIVFSNYSPPGAGLPNQATPIFINTAPTGDFNDVSDIFDIYSFSLGSTTAIKIELSDIPSGDNYDLYVYDSNKLLVSFSNNIGSQDDQIEPTLPAGDYTIIIVAEDNLLTATGSYKLRFENN